MCVPDRQRTEGLAEDVVFILMRKFLLFSIASLLLPMSSATADTPPPNVILFMADDMGAGDTSAYQDWSGNPDSAQLHTPAMDRLARMGVKFTDAHAPSSRCTATRYGLMTGRYSWRTRLKHWVLFGVHGDPLMDRERTTLPEFLRDAGYQTGMVGKWHLGLTYRKSDGSPADAWDDADLTKPLADGPMDHGFDFFKGCSRSHGTSGPDGMKRNTPDQAIGPGWLVGRDVIGAIGNGKQLDGSYVLNEVGNVLDTAAFEFLGKAATSAEKPFFLYFASPSNHSPYTPSKEIGGIPVIGASRNVDGSLTDSTRLDFIYQNDVHLQRLLAWLGATDDPRRPGYPLLENTFIIFTSDNGAEKNNKQFTGPVRSNKGSVYEGGHRVAFIASWPLGGIGDGNPDTPGQTKERLICHTDVYATLAAILDRPLPPVAGLGRGAEDSFSQLAALRGKTSPPRPPVFPNDHMEASKKDSDLRAVLAVRSNAPPLPGKWKLFLDHRFAFDQKTNPIELYNLADDPMEENNLVGDPASKPVLEFLVKEAMNAAGDDGHSRPQ